MKHELYKSIKWAFPLIVNLQNLPPSPPPRSGIIEMPNPGSSNPAYLKGLKNPYIPPFYGGAKPEEDPVSRLETGTSKGSRSALSVPQSAQSYSLGAVFAGIGNTGYAPPDPIIAAGSDYVLEAVNLSFAIYNGSGTQLYNTTFQSFFTGLDSGLTLSDPKVLYDQYSQRWVILLLAYHDPQPGSGIFVSDYLIGVSETSDPTQGWYIRSINAMYNKYFADYPGLGVDPNAIYVTSNQWNTLNQYPGLTQTFEYAQVFVINKSQLYSNQAPNYYVFPGMKNADGSLVSTIKPAHHYGNTAAAYLLNTGNSYVNPSGSWNFLRIMTRRDL